MNCFQNVNHGMDHWDTGYCVTKALEWFGYLVLSCLICFLLVLHCIMYKKINRRCSFKIMKRNRVQILSLSLLLTVTLFIKLTFIMDYADLVLLLVAQLIRFVIWSLTLINFLKSGLDLAHNMPRSQEMTLKILRVSTFVGVAFFTAYAIYLIVSE